MCVLGQSIVNWAFVPIALTSVLLMFTYTLKSLAIVVYSGVFFFQYRFMLNLSKRQLFSECCMGLVTIVLWYFHELAA